MQDEVDLSKLYTGPKRRNQRGKQMKGWYAKHAALNVIEMFKN